MTTDTEDEREVSDLLAGTALPTAETMERLHRRLEESAERADVLDIAYTTIDSPVGTLLLAATERGLLRVAYENEDLDRVLDRLGTIVSPRILRSPGRLDAAAFEIDEYFGRTRTGFDLDLDLSLSNGFRRIVQAHLPRIPYGATESYKRVAELVGNPKAVRAVGSACATNPLPIVVPCHRVLRTDGTLGGYIGGLAAKSALLRLEAGGPPIEGSRGLIG
ncbi:MAG TPA: methylated-DNA--[protein]-cysteine S-methyltransferase [Lacisediminihabitans sp.]|uniref:methylated-DNA--[protein]-cysteine S-methyltransferase n=1 Tax=Lacisediminihabitans sp. TaxID=2787631 RepID=UPI002ED9E5C6